MFNYNKSLAIILCAAGQSARLGQAKQLLPIAEQTLLTWQLSKFVKLKLPIYVVLGAASEELHKEIARSHLNQQHLHLLTNPNWQLGLGSSIAYGIKSLPTSIDGALLLFVDQYLLTTELLTAFITTWQAQAQSILLASAKNIQGPPVIFPKAYFAELAALTEQSGAKAIIKKHQHNTVFFNLPEAFTDIDTPEDLSAFDYFKSQLQLTSKLQ